MEVLVFPKNEEKALQMEKYMKNLFSFAGVPKPERALLQQPLLDESKNLSISEVLAFVHYYYEQIEREYQYVAIDLVQKNIKRLTFEDLVVLLPLVQKKNGGTASTLGEKYTAHGVKPTQSSVKKSFNCLKKRKIFGYVE